MNNPIVKETVRPTDIQERNLLIEVKENSLIEKPLVQVVHKIEKTKVGKAEINPKKDALLDLKSEEQIVLMPKEVSKVEQNKYVDAQLLLAEIESKEMPLVKEIIPQTKIKIDPQALLSGAEQEVNESFRNKVIQSVNKNYNMIKSTLANRNYE
jgi:hypothetical protein